MRLVSAQRRLVSNRRFLDASVGLVFRRDLGFLVAL